MLGITDNWAFAAGTVLFGLQEHNPRLNYDVIIYHQNLSDKNRKLLYQIYPCTFIDYDIKLVNERKFARVSKMAFSRYECFGLLSKYKKVLWLDSDILIKGSISGLIDSCVSGAALYKHEGIPMSISFSSPVPGFDMTRECFNDGIFLFSDELYDPQMLKEWCYEKTNEWTNEINSDQAIINLLLQKFDLAVSGLDIKYNCPPDRESTQTVIVHPWGTRKFWDGHIDPLWDKYYFKWKALGGDGPIIRRSTFKRLICLRILCNNFKLGSVFYNRLSRRIRPALKTLKRAVSRID